MKNIIILGMMACLMLSCGENKTDNKQMEQKTVEII